MLPVPWKDVQDWFCTACGMCCKGYDVVLDFPEWVRIVKDYGVGFTEPGVSRFYLKHKNDGTCAFLYNFSGRWLCSLQQHMKPIACKLWPFKVADKAKFGRPNEALYDYGGRKLYVYADPSCVGLRWGTPSQDFQNAIIPEFIDLALGLKHKQSYSTSQLQRQQTWRLIY